MSTNSMNASCNRLKKSVPLCNQTEEKFMYTYNIFSSGSYVKCGHAQMVYGCPQNIQMVSEDTPWMYVITLSFTDTLTREPQEPVKCGHPWIYPCMR